MPRLEIPKDRLDRTREALSGLTMVLPANSGLLETGSTGKGLDALLLTLDGDGFPVAQVVLPNTFLNTWLGRSLSFWAVRSRGHLELWLQGRPVAAVLADPKPPPTLPPGIKSLGLLQGLPILQDDILSGLDFMSIYDGGALEDLEAVGRCQRLETLHLGWASKLRELGALGQLKQLYSLSLESCVNLSNLQGLSNLRALEHLDLDLGFNERAFRLLGEKEPSEPAWPRLEDLSALSSLTHLRSLRLSGFDAVTDLDWLKPMRSLETLELKGFTALKSVDSMWSLPKLKTFKYQFCAPQVEAQWAKRPPLQPSERE